MTDFDKQDPNDPKWQGVEPDTEIDEWLETLTAKDRKRALEALYPTAAAKKSARAAALSNNQQGHAGGLGMVRMTNKEAMNVATAFVVCLILLLIAASLALVAMPFAVLLVALAGYVPAQSLAKVIRRNAEE